MRRFETSNTDILGEEFGAYKLIRRLGVGGMAETFVAVRSGPSGFTQRVCLKLVLPFFRENQDFIELFEREARLAAKLRHRNIVGVIDFGEVQGTSYMALELVDGLDLRKVLDVQPGEKLPHEFVTLLGLELAEALEHAHNPPPGAGIQSSADGVRGIVHRDISPSNVLLSRQGEILLSDFGVAKAITGASRKQSAVKGKVPYMSPEQLQVEQLDGRSDLFALGVVLFETLAGQRPYEGAHDPATIMLILKGEHAPLAELAPDAPPGLCDLIERLIKPDREDRPATAAELVVELEEFAPPPRVRRQLGSIVTRLRDEADKRERALAEGANPKTVMLPDMTTPGPAAQRAKSEGSGSVGSTSIIPDQLPSAPMVATAHIATTPPDEGSPHNRSHAPNRGYVSQQPSGYSISKDHPNALTPPDSPWSPQRIALAVLGVFFLVGLLIGGLVALWPSSEVPDDKGPIIAPTNDNAPPKRVSDHVGKDDTRPIEPAKKPVVDIPPKKPIIVPVDALDPPEEVKPDKPIERVRKPVKPKGPGRVTITVLPWGNIWINGKPWGRAPLRSEPLPPGKYKISVGQNGPTKTKTIRLTSKQRKSVHFDLTD